MKTVLVLRGDWHQAHGCKLLNGEVGKKPVFKDSEVISLVLAHDIIPYPAKTQYVEFIRANYLDTGRNMERLQAKTVLGLSARIILKMTSHLLRHLLLIDFIINVQTPQLIN